MISNPESASYPEAAVSQDQGSVLQPPSSNSDSGTSALNADDSGSAGLQEADQNRQVPSLFVFSPNSETVIKKINLFLF